MESKDQKAEIKTFKDISLKTDLGFLVIGKDLYLVKICLKMKKDNFVIELEKQYIKRKLSFDNLINFLKANHKFVEIFNIESAFGLVQKGHNAKEKIFFLLIDCLDAAGGNNLNLNGKTIRLLIDKLDKLPNSKKITYKQLCTAFNINDDSNGSNLFEKLKKDYPNFKYKKSALFIKQLYHLQKSKNPIFLDKNLKLIRPIPFDDVIATCIKRILKLKKVPNSSKADSFNFWATKTFKNDAYILEDIWFWGYFGTVTEIKNKKRVLKFNEAKLNMNKWFYPPINQNNLKKGVKEFISIIKS